MRQFILSFIAAVTFVSIIIMAPSDAHASHMGADLRFIGGSYFDHGAAPLYGMGMGLHLGFLEHDALEIELIGCLMQHEDIPVMSLEMLVGHPFQIAAHDQIFLGAGPAIMYDSHAHGAMVAALGLRHDLGDHLGAGIEADYVVGHFSPDHAPTQEVTLALSVSWTFGGHH